MVLLALRSGFAAKDLPISRFVPIIKRGNLLAGLLLIVLVAAGPAIAMLIDFQRELRREREVQARSVALQHAELLSASLAAIGEGTRQMMGALTSTERVLALRPSCGVLLDDLRRGTPDYVALAVVRINGSAVCSSAAAPLAPESVSAWARPFLPAQAFTPGRYAELPGVVQPMLAFAVPFQSRTGEPALLIAGLALRRIEGVLSGLHQPMDGEMVIADRYGTVLASMPRRDNGVGKRLEQVTRYLDAPAGTVVIDHGRDAPRVLGHVPAGPDPVRMFVGASFNINDLVGGIDAAANRGYVLTALGIACSILLALFLGHRFLRAPASVLLEAARRWGSGDLTARADMPASTTSEFAGLGVAFNRMAELLQQQRTELQGAKDALELRVAERTRALLDSNNRLQVEIAERELTEASLRQAQKLQAVGQLAGGVAHDFNNLLTAILGSLELLRKWAPFADSRQIRLLDTATQAVDRGSRLTAQLLAFSRKQPLLAVSVDVAHAIQGVAGLLASTLGAKITLEKRIDPDLWPAMLDPNQFEAAVLNLALNARDAMPGGGRLIVAADNVTTTPASLWSELPPGDYVRVTVSDSGGGMAADVANRAFEPFYSTKPHGEGSGLGLSQVHGMVRQSGGSVSIRSRPGEGTQVIMVLPRSLADPHSLADSADYSIPALARSEAVLLVDDDEQVRNVTQAVLADAGYTVVVAEHGAEALRLMGEEGPRIRVVIADYAMPEMTGRELLQVIKRQWPSTAILLATGYADYPELISQDLPIDQIVRKPFRSNELLARVHTVVQRQDRVAGFEEAILSE